MYRNKEYFKAVFSKDDYLGKIFERFCEYSTIIQEGVVFPQEVRLKNFIEVIQKDVVGKDETVIQIWIDQLLKCGLLEYVVAPEQKTDLEKLYHDANGDITGDANGDERMAFYASLKLPKMDTEIRLTHFKWGFDGRTLYQDILKEQDFTKMQDELSQAIEEITMPYDDKLNKLTNELDAKITEMNKAIDAGVIKNIQVISIYAGIIALLFANVMGIKEFSIIGMFGLLVINFSIITAIFAMTLFTKILIISDKVKSKTLLICIGVLLFTAIPIALMKLI